MIKFTEDPRNRQMLEDFKRLSTEVERQMRRGLYISGRMLVFDLKKQLTQKGRSGRVYTIYRGLGGRMLKKPRRHQASTPGEYPAVISGDYRASIDFKVLGDRRMEFGSGANNKAGEYAEYLENRNQPLGRTSRKLRSKINTNITKEINRGMRKLNLKVRKA